MTAKKNIIFSAIVQLILFLSALVVFLYIGIETIQEQENQLDLNIIAYYKSHPGPGLVRLMKFITFFGSNVFLLPAYIVLIAFFFINKKYKHAVAILIVSLGAKLASTTLKLLYQRSRPEISLINKPQDFSFPSGHSFLSFVFCGILTWLVWQTQLKSVWKWMISIVLLLFTLCIGASRVILNVHFATDVIGGVALGIMWLLLAKLVFGNWVKKDKLV